MDVFEVIRTDDNGCQHLVARGLTMEEAIMLVNRLTARGHKQFYECKRIDHAT